jgi:WD40 repeat protein
MLRGISLFILFTLGNYSTAGGTGLTLISQPPDPHQATALARNVHSVSRCARGLASFSRRLISSIPFADAVWGTWSSYSDFSTTPDGRRVLTYELDYSHSFHSDPSNQHAKVVVLDGRTGKRVSERIFPRTQDSHPAKTIALSPDGKSVYVGFTGNGRLEKWDADTFTVKKDLPLPYRFIRAIVPSPSGRYLAVSVSHDPSGPQSHLWKTALLDLEGENVISVMEIPMGLSTQVYFLPSEDGLVYFSENGHLEVVQFDGRSIFSQNTLPHSLASVCPRVGIASFFKASEYSDSLQSITQTTYPGGEPLRRIALRNLVDALYTKPVFSNDGLYLAYRVRQGSVSEVVVVDLISGQENKIPFPREVLNFKFSPSGESLVVAFGDASHYDPMTARLADYFPKTALEFSGTALLAGMQNALALATPTEAISSAAHVVIDLSRPRAGQTVLEPYRRPQLDWETPMGKLLNVEFRFPDKTVSVPQRLTSLERLRRADHAFATTVENVLAAKKAPPRRGEVNIFAVISKGKAWESAPLISQFTELPTADGKIQLNGLPISFAELGAAFRNVQSQLHPSVTLRLVHARAGTSTPNDPFDIESARQMLEAFRKEFPTFHFKMQIASVPVEDAGDRVFITDLE